MANRNSPPKRKSIQAGFNEKCTSSIDPTGAAVPVSLQLVASFIENLLRTVYSVEHVYVRPSVQEDTVHIALGHQSMTMMADNNLANFIGDFSAAIAVTESLMVDGYEPSEDDHDNDDEIDMEAEEDTAGVNVFSTNNADEGKQTIIVATSPEHIVRVLTTFSRLSNMNWKTESHDQIDPQPFLTDEERRLAEEHLMKDPAVISLLDDSYVSRDDMLNHVLKVEGRFQLGITLNDLTRVIQADRQKKGFSTERENSPSLWLH